MANNFYSTKAQNAYSILNSVEYALFGWRKE